VPKRRSKLIDLAQYFAARGVLGWMQCFSVDQNLHTAARIGSLLHHFSRRHRERARQNVAACFPEAPAAWVDQIVEKSFQHMMQMFLVDAFIGPKLITPDGWPNHVEVGDLRTALEPLARHEAVILIAGHCGNWELMSSFMAAIGYPMAALARPLDNPYLNHWLMSMREARGTQIITKWGATPIVQDILRARGRVAFIADQNAGDGGLFAPFFGRLASSYKSIALLAIRHEAPVVAGWARRIDGRFRYQVAVEDVIGPADWQDQPDPVFYITARYNRAIESMVRRAPEQYLWVHRRWKSRPRHEREGRPFPARLRDKLGQLPWMTPHELARIVAASESETRAIHEVEAGSQAKGIESEEPARPVSAVS